ncbi:MAG: hypothetical protein JWQ40_4004 [Segetibacter sp.]|nr:hypothetical protein [Segetibacter sp.]
MKTIFTLSLLLIAFFGSNAQRQPKGFHLEKPINMAAILAKKPSVAIGFSTVSEARSIINDIMDVAGYQQNFTVTSTTQVDNAAAVIYDGVRYILYNPSFINQLDNAAQDKWASISVIGHEIGHHLLGHTMDARGSQIPKELDADQFSGLVLRRMGASLQQAQLAMKLIGSPSASATHPAERDRLAAISKGWNSTTVNTNRGNADVAISTPADRKTTYPDPNPQTYPSNPNAGNTYPAPSDRRPSYPSTSNRKGSYPNNNGSRRPGGRNNSQGNSAVQGGITYDIWFNGSNAQQYYITAQNQVIMLRGNRVVVVAKIASTNKSNYPYVIYDDQQQIYIDRSGKLYSDRGRNIGYLTRHN